MNIKYTKIQFKLFWYGMARRDLVESNMLEF